MSKDYPWKIRDISQMVAGRGAPTVGVIRELAHDGEVWNFNISESNTGANCEVEDSLSDTVPKSLFAAPLITGTLTHDVLSAICSNHEDIDAHIGQVVAESKEEFLGDTTNDAAWEDKIGWRESWLKEIARVYKEKFWPKAFDAVYANEEHMWLYIPVEALAVDLAHAWRTLGYTGLLLHFRPDLVIGAHGKLYHLQRKTRSRLDNTDSYLTGLSFSMHEMAYNVGLDILLRSGLFGSDAPQSVGGSIIETIWTAPQPDGIVPNAPKKIHPDHNPKVLGLSEKNITFSPTTTKKQLADLRKSWSLWRTNCQQARLEVKDWEHRVIQHLYTDIDMERAQRFFHQLPWREYRRAAIKRGAAMPLHNESACWRYGRKCVYYETVHCGGHDAMDSDAHWKRREANYVREFEAAYNEARR